MPLKSQPGVDLNSEQGENSQAAVYIVANTPAPDVHRWVYFILVTFFWSTSASQPKSGEVYCMAKKLFFFFNNFFLVILLLKNK